MMHHTTRWLGMGSYFLRCIFNVALAVDKLSRRRICAPNHDHVRAGKAVIGLCCLLHEKSMLQAEFVPRSEAKPTWQTNLEFLFSLFNGSLRFKGGATPDHAAHAASEDPEYSWTHCCSGPDCCANAQETQRRQKAGIMRVLLRSRPVVPTLTRWTQTSFCSEWCLMNLACQKAMA